MSFKVASHRKSDRIKVTHYVSPHEIWFKYEDSMEMEKMLEVYQAIEKYGNESHKHWDYSPLIGEIVIVRYRFETVKKCIRARVDFEYKYSKKASVYILWAIDEGFPVRCSKKRITKLPSTQASVFLKTNNPFVFKGTLSKVIPATSKCNILDLETELVKTKCWSEKAINDVATKISEAKSLIFHYDCHAEEQCLFGSIEVNSHEGKSFTLSEVLLELEEAMHCSTNFEYEYQRLTNKNYWDQQHENYKIKEIGVDVIPQLDLKVLPVQIKEIMNAEECSRIVVNKCYEIPTSKYECEKQSINTSMTSGSTTYDFRSISSASSYEFSNEPKERQNFNFKKAIEQENVLRRKVLMHCAEGLLVQSISSLKQTHFSTEVLKELRSKRMTKIDHTQAIVWPHLMREHSVILVNSSKKMQSSTYLPAICSLLDEAHTDHTIRENAGPVMIIICINESEADRILKDCRKFLQGNQSNKKFSCKAAHGQSDDEVFEEQILNGIDVLVTTITNLLKFMKNPFLFCKERITSIVFDEIDSMCNQFNFDDIDSIYEHFCDDSRIQFIVTSKTWHKVLEKFCPKNDVLLCIDSYYEAAIYSGLNMVTYIVDEDDHKVKFFSHFKRMMYTIHPTIIICSKSQEVLELRQMLRSEGICSLFCHDKSDSLKIQAINDRVDRNRIDNNLDVIVCTDDVLLNLNITNAQHIIHYSLPSDFTTFSLRFKACLQYCENLVQDRFSAVRPTSVVFVYQGCGDL